MNHASSIVAESIHLEMLSACPHCGSEQVAHWCFGTDLLHDQKDVQYEYARCESCGVVFESSRPKEEEVYKAYPTEYGPYQDIKRRRRKPGIASRLGSRLAAEIGGIRAFQSKISGLSSSYGEGAVVLDYGCGAGKFLNLMARRGCRTIGLDFSRQAVESVRENGHECHQVDADVWEKLDDSSIDFVRMNHVVEHLYRPREVLGFLHGKIKPGGRLHIAVPNPAGITARLFRSNWHGLDCPRHIILFPPRQLQALLEDAGFVNVKIYQEPVNKDHVRSWGYLANKLGVLRHERIDDLMYSAILQLLFALPCRLAASFGMGDRFHLEAARPD